MNPQDGWVNFADYLELNKDASQRQLQGALDSRKADAEQIRANADRNYARAGQAGFEGNTVDYGRGGEQQKLTMQYGDFVEGLSDPARLESFFAKQAGGGNSMLDAGLASVAGAGQIQEAQKGLEKLRNYVTEREVDTETRRQGGEAARDNVAAQERARQESNARLSFDPIAQRRVNERARTEQANQAFLNTSPVSDNPFWDKEGYTKSSGDLRKSYDADLAKFDPFGKRFAAAKPFSTMPSWAKPKGF